MTLFINLIEKHCLFKVRKHTNFDILHDGYLRGEGNGNKKYCGAVCIRR